ncbi:MAG: 2-5 ligase family protein [Tardiphaga sp.]|nr:2-5 ligase family protein [Tardiphaga sp.]
MDEKTYILTAEMDDASFAWLDALRRQHFPPARNFLSAHLTMFHRLFALQIDQLQAIAMPPAPIDLDFHAVRFLGSGVAFSVGSPALERLRRDIIATVGGELSRQDSQKWLPHVTVQNKVKADAARALFERLGHGFVGRAGHATGLVVWEYLGGPWKRSHRLSFGTT